MPKIIDTPDFKSEAEEADWYPANQDVLLAAFKEAERDGTLTRGTTSKNLQALRNTIQLEAQDEAMAREQADLRGIPYQSYVKMILHEALQQRAAKS